MLGIRHSPGRLPSESPYVPLSRELQSDKPWAHVRSPNGFASRSHTRPVWLSVTVPSLLSVKRLGTGAAPAWRSPSCPEPPQVGSGLPCSSQQPVCPVLGTRECRP